jgi:hypothetical protein
MSRNYIIYYQLSNGEYRIYESETKQLKTIKLLPSKMDVSRFFVSKGYSFDDDGLLNYVNDFEKWCMELKDNKILSIDYKKYYSHIDAVEFTFKNLCKNKYEHHGKIKLVESQWIERCFNAGMMYCQPGTYNSYGYDFSGFYPSILASKDFKIPNRAGKEKTILELPKRKYLQTGYYHIKITCENKTFNKIFMFSKNNTYTHYSLFQAMRYQTRYDVKFELVQDGKPNAYLYDETECESGYEIFGKWYEILVKIKQLYPKNGLIKYLTSSVWGHLTSKNQRNVKAEDIEKYDIGLDNTSLYNIVQHVVVTDTNQYYVLQNNEQLYHYNIRVKAFLTSYGRNEVAKVALKDIDNCIRIHTDGCCFIKEQNFKIDKLIPEQKTTGLIDWNNVNSYEHVDIEEYIPKKSLF